MRSFDLHFNEKGEVLLNNIQGADGGECLNLTQPYESKLGVKERIAILDECQPVSHTELELDE